MSSTDFTPNLALPYLLSNQAQKHVTLNESLRLLDGLMFLSVIARGEDTPPPSPAEGSRYLIGDGASDDWSGHAGDIAFFADGSWLFLTPRTGWTLYDEQEGDLLVYDGADWQSVQPDALQDLTRLGLGGTADEANPLLARLNNALFTGLETANSGTGDLRIKLNKEATGNVMSLLFQTGYSSRAELGLVGDDDLVLKTSPDGSEFFEALRADTATGRLSFPSGVTGLRPQLTSPRTYYVDPAGSDSSDGLSSATAFATLQKAIDVVASLDLGIHDVTIALADGTYTSETQISGPFTGAGHVQITGNLTTPRNVLIETADIPIKVLFGANVRLRGVKLNTTAGNTCLFVDEGGSATLNGEMVFGGGARSHMSVSNRAVLTISTDYEVDGSAIRHVEADLGASCISNGNTVTFTVDQDFSAGFVTALRASNLFFPNGVFVDSGHVIAGRRYQSRSNSIITVSGAGETYFPGDVAGIISDGGLYL